MSFLTDFTPDTAHNFDRFIDISLSLLTNEATQTTPLKVQTLTSADSRVGSLKIAALAFVVMTVSSKYSRVPDKKREALSLTSPKRRHRKER